MAFIDSGQNAVCVCMCLWMLTSMEQTVTAAHIYRVCQKNGTAFRSL